MPLDLAKLRQIVLMLSSGHDGEVVAAAHAVNRWLGAAGLDWHWFAGSIGSGEPADWEARVREAFEAGRQSAQRNGARQDVADVDAFDDHQAAAEWLLDTHGSRLRDREHEFLETMMTWRGWPTEKQSAWLSSLCKRYGYKP